MRKTLLLFISFIILGILFLTGCEEIVDPWEPTPTPPPEYEVGIFGKSRCDQAVYGTETSKKAVILRKEN